MKKKPINRVGIIVKPNDDEALASAAELTAWLQKLRVETIGEPLVLSQRNGAERGRQIASTSDLLVVLGGDGTMISTSRIAAETDVLVIGINHGGLGYLTDFRIEEMFPALKFVLEGKYEIDERVMLSVEHFRQDELLAVGCVLNDVVINKAALARIIEIEISLDNLFVNSFRADGLIVSTPTGSTAYNLSAGGPIVYPSMNAVVLTPICPFTLTNRPIVVPDNSVIELRLKNENEGVVLTLDGQVGYSMQATDLVVVRKSKATLKLVQPPNRNYFDVLRNKLKWGR
ncbi:MAG: NAD(+) kinase [Blastocatellia bacterium]